MILYLHPEPDLHRCTSPDLDIHPDPDPHTSVLHSGRFPTVDANATIASSCSALDATSRGFMIRDSGSETTSFKTSEMPPGHLRIGSITHVGCMYAFMTHGLYDVTSQSCVCACECMTRTFSVPQSIHQLIQVLLKLRRRQQQQFPTLLHHLPGKLHGTPRVGWGNYLTIRQGLKG